MFPSSRSFVQAHLPAASPSHFLHFVKRSGSAPRTVYTLKNNYAQLSVSVHQRTVAQTASVSQHHAQTLHDPIQGQSSRALTDQELVKLLNDQLPYRQNDTKGVALDYRQSGFDRLDFELWKKRRGVAVGNGEIRDVIDAYLELRERGEHCLRRLHPLAYVHIAWKARQENLKAVVTSVVTDVLSLHTRTLLLQVGVEHTRHDSHPWDYLLAIAHLLDLVSDYGQGRHEQVLSLAKAFLLSKNDSLDALPNLSTHALIGLSRTIFIQRPEWIVENTPLLETFVKYLDYAVIPSASEVRPSKERQADEGDGLDNSLIWSLFRLAADLARRRCDEIAYSLFRFLVLKEYVHPAAIQESDQAVNDFRMIVLSALIRSCIEYRWLDGAYRLLQTADISDHKNKDQLSRLMYRIIYAAVQTRSRENIELSSKLMVMLFSRSNELRLSDTLLLHFYAAAMSVEAGDAAVKVYAILRSAPIRARHVFPAPNGLVLDWLLTHICNTGNTEVGNLLAQHLVESPDTLSIYSRGSVIAHCAAMGLALPTRNLWERYSQGQDRNMVVGHARAMLSVVSLFAKRSALVKSKKFSPLTNSLDRLGRATADEIRKSLQSVDLSDQQDTRANENTLSPQKGPWKDSVSSLRAESGTDPSQQEHMMSLTYDSLLEATKTFITSRNLEAQATEAQKLPHGESNSCLISSRSNALDMSGNNYSKSAEDTCSPSADLIPDSAPVTADTVSPTTDSPALGEDADLAFAHHVLDSFRQTKEPLRNASHHDLTSLARGAALVGDIGTSTRTLRFIIDRREVPDLFDLNVVVASMARWEPLQASIMVRKMIKSGIKPNGFTFASVLHGALAKNNTFLAGKVLEQAKTIGLTQLMPEMCIALIHASVNATAPASLRSGTQDKESRPSPQPQTTDEMERKIEYLRQAYDLLTSDACPPYVRTVRLGMRCVEIAMRIDDPTFAFEFWKLMLKAKSDGFSERQAEQNRMLRQRIADKIRRHCQRGRLGTERGREMITELGVRL